MRVSEQRPSGGSSRLDLGTPIRPRLAQLMLAEILVLIGIVAAVAGARPNWPVVGLAGAGVLIVFGRWRGRWLVDWLPALWTLRDRRRRLARGQSSRAERIAIVSPSVQVVDVQGRRGRRLGLIVDQDGWAVVLRVNPVGQPASDGTPLVTSREFASRQLVPPLLRALIRADTELSTVQVVLHRPGTADGPAGVGLWFCLRIDAEHGGPIGPASSLTTVRILLRRAVNRCQDRLEPRGWQLEPLDAPAVAELLPALLTPGGASVDSSLFSVEHTDQDDLDVRAHETWRFFADTGVFQAGLQVSSCRAEKIPALLDLVDASAADSATVSLARRASTGSSELITGTIRLTHHDAAALERSCDRIVDGLERGVVVSRRLGDNVGAALDCLPVG